MARFARLKPAQIRLLRLLGELLGYFSILRRSFAYLRDFYFCFIGRQHSGIPYMKKLPEYCPDMSCRRLLVTAVGVSIRNTV